MFVGALRDGVKRTLRGRRRQRRGSKGPRRPGRSLHEIKMRRCRNPFVARHHGLYDEPIVRLLARHGILLLAVMGAGARFAPSVKTSRASSSHSMTSYCASSAGAGADAVSDSRPDEPNDCFTDSGAVISLAWSGTPSGRTSASDPSEIDRGSPCFLATAGVHGAFMDAFRHAQRWAVTCRPLAIAEVRQTSRAARASLTSRTTRIPRRAGGPCPKATSRRR